MTLTLLKPLSIQRSTNTFPTDFVGLINDEPTNSSDTTKVGPWITSNAWSADIIMSPIGQGIVINDAKIRYSTNKNGSGFIGTGALYVFVDSVLKYSATIAVPTNIFHSYQEHTFPASVLGDVAGKEIRISYYAPFDDNSGGNYSNLYAIDMEVDLIEEQSFTAPDIPTNLMPLDNYDSSSKTVIFSATVSDEENNNVSVEVDFSSDISFSTFSTISGNRVPSGETSTASFIVPSNGIWYWRCRSLDGGGLYSDYSQVMTMRIENNAPIIPINLSPENNTVVYVDNFTISATTSDPDGDSTLIEYQVSESKNFSIIKTSGTLTGGSANIANLLQGNYYWRVRAKDSDNNYSPYTNIRAVYIDTPLGGRLSPQQILSQSGFITVTTTTISDDPDSPNASWAVTSSGASSSIRTSFDNPLAGGLVLGADIQEFRVLLRATNASALASAVVSVYENGVLRVSSPQTTISDTTGIVLSFKWDASVLSNQTGLDVECHVSTTSTTAGKDKGQVDIGAIEWNYLVNKEPQDPVEEISYPVPSITSISKYRVSDEVGADTCQVRFAFDIDVSEWRVNVLGTSWDTGTIAHSHIGNTVSGTECLAEIDWSELYQEGDNRVNIYGKSTGGSWTPYNI